MQFVAKVGDERADAGSLDLPDHDKVVGIVANVKPIKRIDTLVEAFAIVTEQRPDARLVVVGDTMSDGSGRTLEALKAMASRLGIADRVVFTGRVADPRPYILRFAVAVLCSESEGFSNAIIEYMQARRPVVCTDTGGNPELVKDGYNGFLVPVGDSIGLADRIVRLLSDHDLARRIGEAGYRDRECDLHARAHGFGADGMLRSFAMWASMSGSAVHDHCSVGPRRFGVGSRQHALNGRRCCAELDVEACLFSVMGDQGPCS